MRISTKRWPGMRSGLLLGAACLPFLSVAYGVHAGLRMLLGDSVPLPLDGVSPLRLGTGYLAGALTTTLILEALLPRVRRKDEAACVAFLCGIPFLSAIRVAVEGLSSWTNTDVLRVGLLALVLSSVTRAHVWKLAKPHRKDAEV